MDLELTLAGLPDPQARAVIERTNRLGCWPHDVAVDIEPFDAADGTVVVVAGVAKGRPHTFHVNQRGQVTLPG